MKNVTNFIASVAHIKQLALYNHANAQKLIKKIFKLINQSNLNTHYKAVLDVATCSSNFKISKSNLCNTDMHYPCFIILNRHLANYPLTIKSYKQKLLKSVNPHDQYFVYAMLGRNKREFHTLSNSDVVKACQRLLLANWQINHWYLSHQPSTPTDLSLLNKLRLYVKHGFIREALDELFSGATLNKATHTIEITSHLSLLAVKLISKHFYYWNNNSNSGDLCCSIDDMLCGNKSFAKRCHLSSEDLIRLNINISNLKHYKNLGLKYLVLHLNKNIKNIKNINDISKIITLHKVHTIDAFRIINTLYDYITTQKKRTK